eukprot:Plantae.Rhodophyta-Purpureofilum_apyrenoidigerum.ctg12628.p1 GENE.Plantae.Rhodophyta-Purpureofilum_apyrenoidigerum.ctg12628~~Plantae.Rhodophyta-Purpureofilum_apyrenoidigerum.ctg12628.p1  ORF type:complete len:245 (+),score=42.78 Plantae.Rhodophyta-Purpureofilum_apyrenoidigerum.ctg12628:191-925(+)
MEMKDEQGGPVTVVDFHTTAAATLSTKSTEADLQEYLDNTVIVFDWDDTLFASTALTSIGLCVDEQEDEVPVSLQLELIELETYVISVLEEVAKLGKVIIITNSDQGWVDMCCERYFPRVLQYLERYAVSVISARYFYQHRYPNAPSHWKIHAFEDNLKLFCPQSRDFNLLVFGDGLSERKAAHRFGSQRTGCRIKTVKFISQPSISDLMQQISLLLTSLEHIWEHDGSFDIDLNTKPGTCNVS